MVQLPSVSLSLRKCSCELAESVKDVNIASEDESQEQEMQFSTSTSGSIQQNLIEVAKPVIEVTDPITSSGALQGNVEDRSEASTEKHSISVEARLHFLNIFDLPYI